MHKKIAVFASGSGTNAENLIRFFSNSNQARVSMVLCNKPGAGVIRRAENLNVPLVLFTRDQLNSTNEVLNTLEKAGIDLIVLAGFLLLIPADILKAYPGRVINIHPALLPAYGGKGMFGHHVHEAVISNRETESGITIHLIDEEYDKGSNLFQARCAVLPDDSPESLASRIHELEYAHFPKVIADYIDTIN